MEIYFVNLGQISERSMSYVCSVVKVDILERGVLGALFPETDLVFGDEKDNVTQLQVMICVVMLLHGEDFLIVLGVLCLGIKVVLDVEHE